MINNSKILIADDEPRICSSLKTLLCTQNYEVQTCNSGNEALKYLIKDDFDLILLDVFMEGMDGFQVIENIINQKIDTPVIIMTGNASTESAVKALRMGVADYLKKPFEPEELYFSVKNALTHKILKNKKDSITKKLIEREKKLRQIYDNILDVYYEASLDGVILEISPSIEKNSQYKREELIGKSLYEIYTNPADRDKLVETIIDKGSVREYEINLSDKNGAQHLCSMNIELIKDKKDNPIKLVGIFRDITKRKQAEEALKYNKIQLEAVFNNLDASIYITDINTHEILYMNDCMKKVFGKDLTGQICWKSIHENQTAPCEFCTNDKLIDDDGNPTKPYVWEFYNQNVNRWYELHDQAIPWSTGKLVRMEIAIDKTERKLAENALQENEERFRKLFETVPTAIQGYSPDGTIHYWNKGCEKIYGYTKDEAIGKNLFDLIIPPEMRAFVSEAIKQGSKTGEVPPPEELLLMRKDGSRVPVFSSHTLIKPEDKETELYCLDVDMTIQNKLQSQLHQAHKMESIGILAGGLAHDFNNLLYVVLGNIGLVEDNLQNGNIVTENLKEAEKACIKAKELTGRLITFSKGGDPVKKMKAINGLLKDIVISVLSGSNITPEISISDDIRQVNIDEDQIKQAVRNIVVNAREAMDEKGQLKISCENVDIDQKGYLTLNQGQYIKISFKDQGCGISNENLEKIFDPYFSTKDMGVDKGQGLGLTVSYSIIQKHGGLITVESELQTGSTFSVYLPAFLVKEPDLQESEEKPTAQEPVKQPATGTGKILLMDDEKAIRKFLGKVINRLGYDIETCIEGKEAIEIYKKAMESKEPFDVVILDLTNTIGMGGQATMKRLIEINPDVKGIIITGYSDDPVVANFRAYGFSGFIIKPATRDELSKVINEVLS